MKCHNTPCKSMENWCSEWCRKIILKQLISILKTLKRKNIFNINGVVDGVVAHINGVVKSPIQTREHSDNK